MAVGSTAMCTSFKVDILSGNMNFNTTNTALSANTQDSFKVALYTSAATIDLSTSVYTTTGEVASGGGYTTGGAALAILQVPVSTGTPNTTAYVDFTDTQWTSATFSADGALIYNTRGSNNKTVAVLNFGGTKTVSSGTFTIQYPVPATGSSIIQIA
jgi:hypothetical protein